MLFALAISWIASVQSGSAQKSSTQKSQTNMETTQEQTDKNVAAVKEGFAAYFKGDASKMATLLDPEVELNIAGRSKLAGVYKGPEAVLGFGGKIFQLTNNTFSAQPRYFAGNGKFVHILMDDSATIKDKTLTWNEGIFQEFNSKGKIVRIYACFSDQAAWDNFIDGR